MRFLRRIALSASHTFIRRTGTAATPAAALPMMVPMSLLESVREDASVAREDARVAREDTRVAREDARVAREDAKAHAARMKQINDQRCEEVKAHTEFMAQLLEKFYACKIATAFFDRDVARGKFTAHALMEEAMADAWRALRMDAVGRGHMSIRTIVQPPSTVTAKLKALLGFPGVAAYLQVAEEDNGLAQGVLAESADHVLCAVHAGCARSRRAGLAAASSSLLRHWQEWPHCLCSAGGLWRAQPWHVHALWPVSVCGAACAAHDGAQRHAGGHQALCHAASYGGVCGAGLDWLRRASPCAAHVCSHVSAVVSSLCASGFAPVPCGRLRDRDCQWATGPVTGPVSVV